MQELTHYSPEVSKELLHTLKLLFSNPTMPVTCYSNDFLDIQQENRKDLLTYLEPLLETPQERRMIIEQCERDSKGRKET